MDFNTFPDILWGGLCHLMCHSDIPEGNSLKWTNSSRKRAKNVRKMPKWRGKTANRTHYCPTYIDIMYWILIEKYNVLQITTLKSYLALKMNRSVFNIVILIQQHNFGVRELKFSRNLYIFNYLEESQYVWYNLYIDLK